MGPCLRALVPGVGIVLASCAAPELPPVPTPTVWHGPDLFHARRVEMRPGRVWSQVQTCLGPGPRDSTRTTLRLTGRGRTAQGLVDARMEVDGHAIGDVSIAEDGRIVDVRSDQPEVVTVLRTVLTSPIIEVFYQPLQRDKPTRVTVPGETLLSGIPDVEGLTASAMELSVEYLGQTEIAGQRAAGYRLGGQLESVRARVRTVLVELSVDVRSLAFLDTARGLTLVQETSMLFTVRTGAESQTRRMQCQLRYDPTTSRGF